MQTFSQIVEMYNPFICALGLFCPDDIPVTQGGGVVG